MLVFWIWANLLFLSPRSLISYIPFPYILHLCWLWVNFFKPLNSEFYSWQIGAKQTVQFGSVGICLCSVIWIFCVLSFYKDEGIKMKTLMKMICLRYLVCYRQKSGLNEKALDFAGGLCSYMEKTKQNKTKLEHHYQNRNYTWGSKNTRSLRLFVGSLDTDAFVKRKRAMSIFLWRKFP